MNDNTEKRELTREDFSIHPYVAEYVSLIQDNKSEEELTKEIVRF